MTRNYIPNLSKVDWSDWSRQNEFVWSVISALEAIGEKLDYDYVCAVSGCAFRTSFSYVGWNHGNYHVINTPCIIEHTFKMLGYKVTHHTRGEYDADKKRITDSIDKGIPVVTLEGVINCSDACIISGYDNDGDVLLGYSPFMDIPDDHNEPHDETGYFRKSNWHEGFCAQGSQLRIITIDEKCEKLSADEIFQETLKLVVHLIKSETIVYGQYNGIEAHKAFANALLTYDWDDNFEPYLNVMCNFKQYQDKQYTVKYLIDNGRNDLAVYYEKITEIKNSLAKIIPQDFTAFDLFGDKVKLKPFSDILLQIADLEDEFAQKV
ncbi:MAG: cysteine peptidase family C39 domain-containing protein [Eubacteriales bacterium]